MSGQDADDMAVPGQDGAVSWRVIKVVDFASECITDLERAESWVRRRRKKQARMTDANRAGAPSRDGDVTAGAWQPQRIAMRRRTTGHRSYRMPVRLRLGLISRGHSRKHRVKRVKLSATEGKDVSLMPRLQRRRMRDLMLQKGRLSPDTQAVTTTVKELDGDESAGRGGACTWLESHAWLAKRMRMDVRWRGKWVVPVTGRTWGQRHVVRRLKCGAVFQDCSFLSCLQIEASSAEVLATNLAQAFGLGPDELELNNARSGGRAVDVLLFSQDSNLSQTPARNANHDTASHNDSTNFRPICPARVIWRPTLATPGNDTPAALWLWVHPLAHDEVTKVLESVSTCLTFTDISAEVVMFRVRGARAHASVASVLADQSASNLPAGVSATRLLHKAAREARDVAVFPSGAVLSSDLSFRCGDVSSSLADRVPSLVRRSLVTLAPGAGESVDDDEEIRVECPVTGSTIASHDFVSYFAALRPSDGQRRLARGNINKNDASAESPQVDDSLLEQLQLLSRLSRSTGGEIIRNPFTADSLWRPEVRAQARQECAPKMEKKKTREIGKHTHVPALVAFHVRNSRDRFWYQPALMSLVALVVVLMLQPASHISDITNSNGYVHTTYYNASITSSTSAFLTNGCDLIVPRVRNIGQQLATRLSLGGALAVGVADMELAMASDARPSFPRDFPDSVCAESAARKSEGSPRLQSNCRGAPGAKGGAKEQDTVRRPRGKLSSKARSTYWLEQSFEVNAKAILGCDSDAVKNASVWRGTLDTWQALVSRCLSPSWTLPTCLSAPGLFVCVVVRMHRRQPDGVSSRLVPGSHLLAPCGGDAALGFVTSTSSMACTSASEDPAVGIGFCTVQSFVALVQTAACGGNQPPASPLPPHAQRKRRRGSRRLGRTPAVHATCRVRKHTTKAEVFANATITLLLGD